MQYIALFHLFWMISYLFVMFWPSYLSSPYQNIPYIRHNAWTPAIL